MEVKYIEVGLLKAYENNPRNNEIAVEVVANSIKEFGFKVPIIIDRNYVIVVGHTRLLAAKEIGMDKVPCIIANDLTGEQIKAFRLADNKVGELASWDYEKLQEELREIQTIDMSEFEFELLSEIELDDFFEEDEKEEKEKEPKQIQCPNCEKWFEE